MSNLDRVRAEIKRWERDFAARHGRDPSVQDIKALPPVAEKYRLYKHLARAAAPLPRPRPADPVPPLPGFNPFSPSKKHAARAHATPTKPSLPSSSHDLPVSTTAVSRARKRLRGDPVSPSPSKPKRQRGRSPTVPPRPSSDHDSSSSECDPDQELPVCDFTSSFVADSPVKAPAGGKSFKLLFDDALPALSIPKISLGASVTQPSPPPRACVPKLHGLASKAVTSGSERPVGRPHTNIFPTKSSHPSSLTVSDTSRARTSLKRALDNDAPAPRLTEPGTPLQSRYPLVPPTPPPQDSASRDTSKGKAKSVAARKKSRVEKEESDEGTDSSDSIPLRVATAGLDRRMPPLQHTDEFDWDPLLHLEARNHDPADKRQTDANHHASGTFSMDLPDKFRRVLAISPSQTRNNTEERVVRGLLYGDRIGHYNPSRGGDIWDAGETDDGANGDAETEDDWEGEPVPWEVGEW